MTKLEKHIYQSSQRVILKTQVTSIQNPVHEIICVISEFWTELDHPILLYITWTKMQLNITNRGSV